MNDGVDWAIDDIDPDEEPLLKHACYALDVALEHNDLRKYKDIMARAILTMERMRDAVEIGD